MTNRHLNDDDRAEAIDRAAKALRVARFEIAAHHDADCWWEFYVARLALNAAFPPVTAALSPQEGSAQLEPLAGQPGENAGDDAGLVGRGRDESPTSPAPTPQEGTEPVSPLAPLEGTL